MPHTISLKCFSEDFSTSANINHDDLLEIIRGDKNFEIVTIDSKVTLNIFVEENNEWYPLLWLAEEDSYINSSPIFKFNLYYDLVRISKRLNATILTEDGFILFTPKYGLLHDPDEGVIVNIEIAELQSEILETGNLKLAIENLRTRLNTAKTIIPNKFNKEKPEKWLTSKPTDIIAILLLIVIVIYFILKYKK